MNNLSEVKYKNLIENLKSFGSAVVAFSGGVDSTFLLWAAKEALGEKAAAVTVSSILFPESEMSEAEEFCRQLGVKQVVLKFDAIATKGFKENPADRCYLCKKELFGKICDAASELGMNEVLDGSNLDDEGDYRPGQKAIKELGVKSPLKEAGLTKKEIRELSKKFNLPTWNKPSFACLASRFPYGEEISEEKLARVDKAEQLLKEMGFSQMRVRSHGDVARIEILSDDFQKFLDEDFRKDINEKFKEYGFSYTALDLLGYRTGSMNEVLNN